MSEDIESRSSSDPSERDSRGAQINLLHVPIGILPLSRPSHLLSADVGSKQDCLNTGTPARGVKYNTHKQARYESSTGQRDDPAHVDPRDHAPVDTPPRAVAEADAHGGTADALGGRDGELELGRHDDGDGGAELHREAARGRVQGDLVAERAHDVVAVRPEADDDARAAKRQDPGRHGDLGADFAGLPDEKDRGVGPDGVGDVVGAVGEGGGGGGEDLEEGVGVFSWEFVSVYGPCR